VAALARKDHRALKAFLAQTVWMVMKVRSALAALLVLRAQQVQLALQDNKGPSAYLVLMD